MILPPGGRSALVSSSLAFLPLQSSRNIFHRKSSRAGRRNLYSRQTATNNNNNMHKILGSSFATNAGAGGDDHSARGRRSGNSNLLSSKRGRDSVKLLPTYLADARSVQKYSRDDCPGGALQLGVAESLILEDWLVPAINVDLNLEADSIYYQPTPGREDCRAAMSGYIERLLGLGAGRLDPDGLVIGAGCNAVLENLCFCLAEPGDSVLIPTPYYAAFEFDLVARASLAVEPVTTQCYHPDIMETSTNPRVDPALYYPNVEALDAAYERSVEAGHQPRILLLSHPHNPLGICYPAAVIQTCIDWCRDRSIHLVSDEIYAGSVYRAEDAGFVSALKIGDAPESGLGPYVHWVYALSKDFCLSGLRVGAAYTENDEIRYPMQKLNDLCQVSSSTQRWTTLTMTRKGDNRESGNDDNQDRFWTEAFRHENHKRLMHRSDRIISCLEECEIPYLMPTAGLFVWIDLSKYLPVDDPNMLPGDRERSLYLELVQEYGLLLTPGWNMRNERPGFFRCVFTAATDQEFELSLERFRFLAAKKNKK